ncbi:hypothetical protein ARMSODRAFT_967198 [Armillaria solidipes]|uniref:Uncharacterized protein n=1 Tax=Armillaria solidipes TaxID=1076256 RepID=A0A2H3AN32_9AGAR|nr:hypothetical protein ARMSODRAFT_967198 [Armillaria solidipes]
MPQGKAKHASFVRAPHIPLRASILAASTFIPQGYSHTLVQTTPPCDIVSIIPVSSYERRMRTIWKKKHSDFALKVAVPVITLALPFATPSLRTLWKIEFSDQPSLIIRRRGSCLSFCNLWSVIS